MTHKEIRQKKSGDPYLSLTLGDRTGDMDAKMWDNVADVMDTFDRDDFVRVKGVLQIFQNRPQFTDPQDAAGGRARCQVLADYFPASTRDPEEMWAELQGIVAGIDNPHLRALLEITFGEPVSLGLQDRSGRQADPSRVSQRFDGARALPLRPGRSIAPNYRNIDVDLLLTGALLHDLGKIDELTYERGFSLQR